MVCVGGTCAVCVCSVDSVHGVFVCVCVSSVVRCLCLVCVRLCVVCVVCVVGVCVRAVCSVDVRAHVTGYHQYTGSSKTRS